MAMYSPVICVNVDQPGKLRPGIPVFPAFADGWRVEEEEQRVAEEAEKVQAREEEKQAAEEIQRKTALMALEGSDPTWEEWRDMGPEASERTIRELAEAAEKFHRSQGAESSAMGAVEKLALGPLIGLVSA